MARRSRKAPVFLNYGPTMTSGLLVCVAAAIALLGYMRLKEEQHRLDAQIGLLEYHIREARIANRRLQTDYETLVSSTELNNRLRRMKLDLRMPGERDRVVLPEPGVPESVDHPQVAGTPLRPSANRTGIMAVGAGWENGTRR